MTKEDIIAFRTVAKLRNFSRAAEALFIPQPSLSRKIIALEKELGVTLLERTKRSVKLTNAGIIFFQESGSLLEHEHHFITAVQKANQDARLVLEVAFMGLGLAHRFLPAINRLQKVANDLSLHIHILDYQEIHAALTSHTIEMAIAADFGLSALPSIRTKRLFLASSMLVLPADYPSSKDKEFAFTTLATEKFIVLENRSAPKGYETVLGICQEWGFRPNIIKHCDSIEEILFYVQAHQGVAILPSFDCPPVSQGLRYIPLQAESPISIIAARYKSNANPAIRYLLELLDEYSEKPVSAK